MEPKGLLPLFQSTPLMRGETRLSRKFGNLTPFQSTPLMRGETVVPVCLDAFLAISIHSPHARGDQIQRGADVGSDYFNPLPSCEGRRAMPFPHIL